MKTGKKVLFASIIVLAVFIYGKYGRSRLPVIPTHTVPRLNAYDYYIRAGDGAERDTIGLATSFSIPPGDIPYTSFTLKQKKAFVKASAPDLELVRLGFAFPCVCPPVRAGEKLYLDYYRFALLGKLLCMEGQVKTDRGDWNGAAASYMDAIKLGVDIPHGSTFTWMYWGMHYEREGRQGLWAAVSHLNKAEARAAAQRLASIDACRTPFADSLREEKYYFQSCLLSYYKHFDWANTLEDTEFANEGIKDFYLGERQELALSLMAAGKKGVFDQYTRFQDTLIKNAGLSKATNMAHLFVVVGFPDTPLQGYRSGTRMWVGRLLCALL